MKVAILLSLVALGLAGFLAYDRFGGCSSCKGSATPDASPTAALEEEIRDLKSRIAMLENRPEAVPPPAAGPTLHAAARPATTGAAAPAPEAVAEMEKRLAALEEYKAKAEEEAKARPRQMSGRNWRGAGNFYTSVDDAKEDLKLTDQQKGDFDRIAADAKRDLEEVWKIPDEDGKTYEQVMADLIKPGSDGQPKFDIAKVLNFRTKTIPGRNETYGAADKRIRDTGKAAMRNSLSTEQQSKFDKANTDAMFGTPGLGAGMMTSFAMPAIRVQPGDK